MEKSEKLPEQLQLHGGTEPAWAVSSSETNYNHLRDTMYKENYSVGLTFNPAGLGFGPCHWLLLSYGGAYLYHAGGLQLRILTCIICT